MTLAYIGDGIYDLVIRVSGSKPKANTRASELHKRTSQIVKAHTQAEMMEVLLPILTEEEAAVYKRGRNAKIFYHGKKMPQMSDYRKATGFEALMGYLYLKDEFERLVELVKTGVEEMKLKL